MATKILITLQHSPECRNWDPSGDTGNLSCHFCSIRNVSFEPDLHTYYQLNQSGEKRMMYCREQLTMLRWVQHLTKEYLLVSDALNGH